MADILVLNYLTTSAKAIIHF